MYKSVYIYNIQNKSYTDIYIYIICMCMCRCAYIYDICAHVCMHSTAIYLMI